MFSLLEPVVGIINSQLLMKSLLLSNTVMTGCLRSVCETSLLIYQRYILSPTSKIKPEIVLPNCQHSFSSSDFFLKPKLD
jgi:hypothetical protein